MASTQYDAVILSHYITTIVRPTLYGECLDAMYGIISDKVTELADDLVITYSQATGGDARFSTNFTKLVVETLQESTEQLHCHYSYDKNNQWG